MQRMNSLLAVLGVCVCVVVAGVAPVSAQTVPAAPSPRIFSVVPDLSGTTLVISGLRFGEGPEVWVDGELVPVLPGATDERLEIDVPAAWRVQPGTYRLIVRTAAGRTDSFEVMVGGAAAGGAESRRAGVATEADADPVRRAGERAGASTPGGTRPRIAPRLVENGNFTAVGLGALFANTTGSQNTAAGYQALYFNTTGSYNTAAGSWALMSNTTGSYNTAAGYRALYANTTGSSNTAAGFWALHNNTTGTENTAAGRDALSFNSTGTQNMAAGTNALRSNTTGSNNTAAGMNALYANTMGSVNTAAGSYALFSNTTGSYNTAAGVSALYANTTGYYNTAAGTYALSANTTGYNNTASGYQALYANTTGHNNTAAGMNALYLNTTGFSNMAAGMSALAANTTGSNNTAAGPGALYANTTGNSNVALGYQAGNAQTTGSDNVYVANAGVAGESGTIRIGTAGTHTDTYLAGTVRATAFVGGGAGLTDVAAATAASASDLVCAGCVSATEVSFTYAGSASAGGPATSALTAATATTATTATTAANALALGGLAPSAYAATGHTHVQFGSMVLQGSTGQNTALGVSALGAVSTGTANLALGYNAGNAQTTGSDNVYVANAGVAGESGKIRIGAAGTHTDTYLAGTVRATAFVGDGAGLTNVTCAGSGGSSVPPSAPDSRSVLNELQQQRRTITAQAEQLAAQGTQLAAQVQQMKALQARLAQLEARQTPSSRPGGTR
jgi:hypothetical protein